jgi:hypothetical protein
MGIPHHTKSPFLGCLCGINAYKNPQDARHLPILGKVELTGVVDEYESGYRAEWGEIIEVRIFASYHSSLSARDLRQAYKTNGPFPKERLDILIESRYEVPVSRVMHVGWKGGESDGRDRQTGTSDNLGTGPENHSCP